MIRVIRNQKATSQSEMGVSMFYCWVVGVGGVNGVSKRIFRTISDEAAIRKEMHNSVGFQMISEISEIAMERAVRICAARMPMMMRAILMRPPFR